MVGNRPMATADQPKESLAEALQRVHPELDAVREVATEPVYLVGGAVRDLLLGRGRADIDLVVEGDAAALASRLGADVVSHERFATAKVSLDGHEVDIASARAESYPHPGALPVVEPASGLEADLARRDFTINAMAIPLRGEPIPIDPHGGRADLDAGLLRVLHPGSFLDDPTRALRAARYAARFGFELEPETAALLRAADLSTVSADRRDAELLRLAGEAEAPWGFSLLAEWGLVELREGGAELTAGVASLLRSDPWNELVPRDRALFAAALGAPGGEEALSEARPQSPSEAVALAAGRNPLELLLARALGGEWLDRYLDEWRHVTLEIDGETLIAAGVRQGPAIGRGLDEALRRKLDGEICGREQELRVALEVARSGDGVA
jgi:tRNA nucleotidyltransferase (CCA-adding enzyme)